MTQISSLPDYADRDASIATNTYTTVLRRERVPHETFATYWRDVHGPLCARIPGLGWYVQHHLSREQDAHLWPEIEGVPAFPNYELDGGVEIGFTSKDDQERFQEACPILFADEQNMFAATVAYDLPDGSMTFVDRVEDGALNGDDGLDRIHVHIGAVGDDETGFRRFLAEDFAPLLASDPAVLKLRLHAPTRYSNDTPAPPAPNVGHDVTPERELIAILELAFQSPLTRRAFYESALFRGTVCAQQNHFAYATGFAVSGIYSYVRDRKMTLAGLRGSRPAQLIRTLGAGNQIADDVMHLIRTGELSV